MPSYAILTGDIVGSTELDAEALNRSMVALAEAARQMVDWAPGGTTAGFARRSGDGWQIALGAPDFALRATLYCQAVLRRLGDGVSTRIAVAEGDGILPPDGDPNAGHGPAFTASGRALEQMDKHTRLAHADGGAKAAVYRLADAITSGWTPSQAAAIAEMLPPGHGTQASAAARLGITRTAVQQALAAADYRALRAAYTHLENLT